MDKASSGLPKPMQDACQSCIQVQKGADKREGLYISSGSRTLKKKIPYKGSGTIKNKSTDAAEQQAGSKCLNSNVMYPFFVSESLHFCDRRHEHYGGRVGDRGRKQDTGKCESGKNTVDAECFAGRNPIHLKPLRNQNDLNSGKHGEKKPIHRNRKGSTEDFM